MSHVLVVANETVAGPSLIEALKRRAADGVDLITVLAPVSHPHTAYVVYEDTRRAAAGRRLDRTLSALHEAGIAAHGLVVEADPADAVRDAIAMLEPRPTEIIVSTHPKERSAWLRRKVIDRIRDAAQGLPVEHVVVDLTAEGGEANVLVVANETVVGDPLLARIRERAARSPASFLILCPQSDPNRADHPEAERRLRRALAILRGEGIDAHGQVSHPDPYTAAMQAIHDERIDEIIVSTFAPERSPVAAQEPRPAAPRRLGAAGRARDRLRGGRQLMTAHAEAHHGPPIANQSSRVDSTTLGMLLFIASEIMLFGSFFTAYFFVRVVNDAPEWPPAALPPAGVRGRGEHRDPAHVELHDALGAPGDQARQPRGHAGGPRADARPRADLPAHPGARVLPDRVRAARRGLRLGLLRPHRACTEPTSSSG